MTDKTLYLYMPLIVGKTIELKIIDVLKMSDIASLTEVDKN